ncbi:MAG: YeeE/YedE thiosulfate transporter family protein [Halieaceae bacterium]
MDSYLLWPLLLGLALLMGFVADRTNLCTVSAVMALMIERNISVLWGITRIVLWVLGISLLLQLAFPLSPLSRTAYDFSLVSLLGGLVFGVGAVLNGGCSLQLITRLGRGDLGMIVSIAGLPIGAIAGRWLMADLPQLRPVRVEPVASLSADWQFWLLGVLGLWMLVELFRLLRDFRLRGLRARLLASDYQPTSSAALLGIGNGLLFSLVGTWMFTYTLIQSLTNLANPHSEHYSPVAPILWWLLAAYLFGIFASAYQSRHHLFQGRPSPLWVRYFLGGLLMGLGAVLVPGGNDMLLLNGIPGLSAHALPAYLAMLVGIGLSLAVMMHFSPERDSN